MTWEVFSGKSYVWLGKCFMQSPQPSARKRKRTKRLKSLFLCAYFLLRASMDSEPSIRRNLACKRKRRKRRARRAGDREEKTRVVFNYSLIKIIVLSPSVYCQSYALFAALLVFIRNICLSAECSLYYHVLQENNKNKQTKTRKR